MSLRINIMTKNILKNSYNIKQNSIKQISINNKKRFKKIFFKKLIFKEDKYNIMKQLEYKRMLTASDISFILKRYGLDFNKVCIIGCPEHLEKTIKEDINKIKKAYICHYNSHWFVIFYINIKNIKYILTFDSFGSILPIGYRNILLGIYDKFEFYYCPSKLQSDGYTCGIFSLSYILNIFNSLRKRGDPVENIKSITKKDIIFNFNKITKIIINELHTT